MKKVLTVIIAAVMTALLVTGVSADSDEYGHPDGYASDRYPQRYGGSESNINKNDLADGIEVAMRADKYSLDDGRVTFTVSIEKWPEGAAAQIAGVTPAYDVTVFDPDAPNVGGTWGNINARILLNTETPRYTEPAVPLDTSYDAQKNMYLLATAWESPRRFAVAPSAAPCDFLEFSLVPKTAGVQTVVYAYVQFLDGGREFAKLLAVNIGENPAILTAGVSVGADLTLKVSASVPYSKNTPSMTFTHARFGFDAPDTVTVKGTKGDDGLWHFSYAGIGCQAMTDRISFTLNDGEKVLDSRTDFTVRQYVENLAAQMPDYAPLASAMLQFGAQSQLYAHYRTDEPAAEPLTTVEIPDENGITDDSVYEETDPAKAITGASLLLWNAFSFRFTAASTDGATFGFEGSEERFPCETEEEDGVTYILTPAVSLTNLFRNIVVENGTNRLVYSGKCYIANMLGDPEAGNTVKALFNFYAEAAKIQSAQG